MTDIVELCSDGQQIIKFVKTSDIIGFKLELIRQNSSVCDKIEIYTLYSFGTNIELLVNLWGSVLLHTTFEGNRGKNVLNDKNQQVPMSWIMAL